MCIIPMCFSFCLCSFYCLRTPWLVFLPLGRRSLMLILGPIRRVWLKEGSSSREATSDSSTISRAASKMAITRSTSWLPVVGDRIWKRWWSISPCSKKVRENGKDRRDIASSTELMWPSSCGVDKNESQSKLLLLLLLGSSRISQVVVMVKGILQWMFPIAYRQFFFGLKFCEKCLSIVWLYWDDGRKKLFALIVQTDRTIDIKTAEFRMKKKVQYRNC
jgi:hypothetical protein